MQLDMFIYEFAKKHKGILFDSRFRILDQYTFNIFYYEYREQVKLENTDKKDDDKIKYAAKDLLVSEFERIIGYELPKKCLEQKIREIAFKGVNNEIDKALIAATGNAGIVEKAVLQHWFWQVKRKMLKLPVVNHIFVTLYEPLGESGKSTLVKILVKPLSEYTLEWEVPEISDSRNTFTMQSHYVCILDEMAKAHKSDIDSLKKRITSDTLDSRRLGTNQSIHSSQNLSFIGTSNKSLDTIIVDSTNMRRFFEINCLPKMDWDAVNSLDALAIWQSIDENLEKGYLVGDVLEELRTKQLELRTPDSFEQFVSECELVPTMIGGTIDMPSSSIYEKYKHFCEVNKISYPLGNISFGKRMKAQSFVKADTAASKGWSINARHKLKTIVNGYSILGGNAI